LLALWLLAAYGVYALLPDDIKNEVDALTALIGSLVTGLIGFGVQQWKLLSSAEEERNERIQKAKGEIETLRELLRVNPAEGARRYRTLSMRKGTIWRSGRIRNELDEAWQDDSPNELQETIGILPLVEEPDRFFQTIAEWEDVSRPPYILEWVIKHLDDYWRRKAVEGLRLLSTKPTYRVTIKMALLQDLERQPWRQILGTWSRISFWRDLPLPALTDVALTEGLKYLELKTSPFGNGIAETDGTLLKTRIAPHWWETVRLRETTLYPGDQGAGKTASALWMAREALMVDRSVFPVYWRGMSDQLRFEVLVQTLTHTIMYYLAITPKDFLKSSISRKVSMSHLLARYFAPRLDYHFRMAGVPEVGDGTQMVQEIERLAQSAPTDASLSENELLNLLRQARPRPFDATLILLDVQSTPQDPRPWGRRLSTWCERLGHAGVFVKMFMPPTQASAMTTLTKSLGIPHYNLTFSPANLTAILEQRLKHSGENALREWCDPVIRPSLPDLDVWIVHAAEGKPGRMFRLGNELIRRIGQKQALLTLDDLIDILGDPPEEATG
jgi:hypothetical protein